MLSGIQHFAFCKRQWWLVHVCGEWAENFLTASGRVLHDKVDDPYADFSDSGTRIVRSMHLVSRKHGFCGVADVAEFRDGNPPLIVEYKRGKPKSDDCDRLQLAAQAMAAEEMFDTPINTAAIFYGQTRRRETVNITDDLRKNVTDMFAEMHEIVGKGTQIYSQFQKHCKACSLFDICRPRDSIKAATYIKGLLEQ